MQKVCLILFIAFTTTMLSCEEVLQQPEDTGPVELKFSLHADSSYRYTIKNNVVLNQKVDKDNSITINQNMMIMCGYNVVSASAKSKVLSVTYERITMSTGNQLLSIDYDSENDNGTEAIYEDLRNLIDKTFTMTVTETGKVLSSEPIIKGNSKQSIYGFNDSSLRKVMLHALSFYPENAVVIGDIWDEKYSSSVGFANVRIKNKYQLVSVDKGIAHIELQGLIVGDEHTSQAQNSNMSIKGTQSGSLDVVVESGLVKNGKIKQTISGDMNITGQSTPVDIESQIYIIGSVKNNQPK